MKVLQKILFTFAMVIGLSLAAMAQSHDDTKKPTPPKQDPPVVTPQPKNPPPRNDPRPPKKPGIAFILWKNESGESA